MKKSRAAKILDMLMLLRSHGKLKSAEIADKIDVSQRMIREYKKDLQEIGVYVNSELGRCGGYYIEFDNTMLDLGLDEQEFSVLKVAKKYLKQEEFVFMREYELILDKINAYLQTKDENKDLGDLVLAASPNIDQQEEKLKYMQINEALMNHKKVQINYFSLTSGLNERVIRPYGMYIYQGFWYMMGYCELRKAIRQFKLSRIKEFEILDENFDRPDNFSLSDYLEDCIGIIYDQDKFEVELKIDFPMSIKVSERVWVDNQQITFYEDNSILFKAEMTGLDDIVNWVLSMGGAVEVLEPEVLKERVNREARKILEKN
ncbi:helix-turn-helix transcriptional regulator [Sporohalobacter salinus]|uniref:helix-turn-helix transcriptional regulator n=1 Tax=Sporohalobacter salinus TaxID=1494606 RepID=UPI00195F9EF7|nr:transcriptional regulator [Sporohalobacter salinus]MBM7624055.1 putative DNA-binding transcriptional regulator YafY [Sporohalobacter salinus]